MPSCNQQKINLRRQITLFKIDIVKNIHVYSTVLQLKSNLLFTKQTSFGIFYLFFNFFFNTTGSIRQ